MAKNLNSLADLSGETIAGHLEVIRQTAHKRYAVRCTRCSALMEGVRHDDLIRSPRCHNRGCDRPKPTTLQSFQEELEAHEAAEREENERPIREAEAKLTKSFRELHKATKEQITAGKDADAYVDPSTLGFTLTIAQAEARNAQMVNEYRAAHPEWYPGEGNCNVKALTDYWDRNGIRILSVPIIERSVARLQEYGLLESRPEPTPEPELIEETIQPEPVDDGSEWGWVEGEKVRKSAWAIKQMSSREYLEFVRIPFSQLVRPVNPVKY
jgi:hypothetical protein